jgi:hypothetical protein
VSLDFVNPLAKPILKGSDDGLSIVVGFLDFTCPLSVPESRENF